MTAAYMTRCVYLTFFGEYRGGHASTDEADHEHETHVTAHEVEVEHARGRTAHDEPHESPPLHHGAAIILAVLSTVAGLLNWAAWPFHSEKFSEWFEPTARVSRQLRARHVRATARRSCRSASSPAAIAVASST